MSYSGKNTYHVALEQLATCCYEYRNLDGSGNNKQHPTFGLIEQPLQRRAPAYYSSVPPPALSDGCSLSEFTGRANPRTISNAICAQEKSIPNSKCISNLFWLWAQFLDHDITVVKTDPIETDPIEVTDPNDPLFPGPIPFDRSVYIPEICNEANPRQQVNSLSPFIDGSVIYGTDEKRNAYMREFCGGRLLVTPGNLPPFNNGTMANNGPAGGSLFVCGDIRANEHVGLASIHTLFIREHNYWANKLACVHPELCDEQIYQRAKLMVEAEIEAITFNEFLPLLLGKCDIDEYCYNPELNPQVEIVFSTAAYRFGHTMIPTEIIPGQKLRDLFFASWFICNKTSVDEILCQFANGTAEELDAKKIDDLRNFLFGPPGNGGLDLAALNIQRGRDHGIALLNDILKASGFEPIDTFEDLEDKLRDPSEISKLEDLYTDPNYIDIFIYGLLEKPVGDSLLGPLFSTIIEENFIRLRDGDRLWYENRLTCEQQHLVNNTKLSDIIRRNTCNKDIQENVFINPQCCKCKALSKCEEVPKQCCPKQKNIHHCTGNKVLQHYESGPYKPSCHKPHNRN